MDSKRSQEQVAGGSRGRLTVRQRAVAHLWGQCGWSVVQLGELFDVSGRTIRRDLRAARVAKALARRAKRSATDLARQARGLLAVCGRLRQAIGAVGEGPGSESSGLWNAALQARLLGEERKLLALLASLPGAGRVAQAEEVELPAYLDPELLRAVAELAEEQW